MKSPEEQIRQIDEELKDLAQPTSMPKYLFPPEIFKYAGPTTFWVRGMVAPRFTMLHLAAGFDNESKKFQTFGIAGMDCYRNGSISSSSYCFNWIDEPPEEPEIHRIIAEVVKQWLDGKKAVEESYASRGDFDYFEEGYLPGEDYLHGKNRPR